MAAAPYHVIVRGRESVTFSGSVKRDDEPPTRREEEKAGYPSQPHRQEERENKPGDRRRSSVNAVSSINRFSVGGGGIHQSINPSINQSIHVLKTEGSQYSWLTMLVHCKTELFVLTRRYTLCYYCIVLCTDHSTSYE